MVQGYGGMCGAVRRGVASGRGSSRPNGPGDKGGCDVRAAPGQGDSGASVAVVVHQLPHPAVRAGVGLQADAPVSMGPQAHLVAEDRGACQFREQFGAAAQDRGGGGR